VCAVRAFVRHRDSLVRTGCEHLLRVQKALDQMNVQLHRAVTDITGETGQAILEAIIKGERAPEVLAQLRNSRCKKTEAEICEKRCAETGAPSTCSPCASRSKRGNTTKSSSPSARPELRKQMDGLADQTKEAAPPKVRPDKRCDEKTRQHLFEKFGWT